MMRSRTNLSTSQKARRHQPMQVKDDDEPEAPDQRRTPESLEDDALAEDDTEEPQSYTIKVDGQEQEVSLDELKKGYQLESDYRNKTATLGEERRQLEAERQQSSPGAATVCERTPEHVGQTRHSRELQKLSAESLTNGLGAT